jgi:3-dehydroquinate synthase
MSGKGEIIKYALLSESIYNLCLSKNFSLDQVIIECSKYKQKIVQSDFKDQNIRSILNLGHTIGHALEVELKIPHGVAVLMGMKYLFKAMGFKDSLEKFEIVCKKLEIDLEKLELAEYSKFDFDRFWTYLGFDKKRTNGSVKLVLVKKLGEPFTENITLSDLRTRLESLSDFSR